MKSNKIDTPFILRDTKHMAILQNHLRDVYEYVKVWILEAIYKTKAYWKLGVLRTI